jgi:hypothetical protein
MKKWTIIVRTQGKGNNLELSNALNSIIAQDYDNKSVILTIHSKNEKAINNTINFIKPFQKSLEIIPLIIKEKQGNRSHPLNIALKKQSAEYISFLDHDDIYYPNMGSRLISMLEEKNIVFAFGGSIKVLQEKVDDNFGNKYLYTINKSRFDTKTFNTVSFLLDNFIPFNTFVMKTSLIDNNLFDENLDYLEDWDWLRRLALKKDFSVIQTKSPVSEYRVRNDNTDTYNDNNYKKWEKSRKLTDKNISDKKITLEIKEILEFRKEYNKSMENLYNEIHKLEMNPAYRIWVIIRDNKVINHTIVQGIRSIRNLREK